MLPTFELDGTQNQSLAVVLWPQVSGRTSSASAAAAGLVGAGAYQDLALDVYRLIGSQELEGLKSETGIVTEAIKEGLIGVVHRTSTSRRDSVTGQY